MLERADETFDVAVVGAGPAGLSAALVLGRARRSVLLLDGGPPRNSAARRAHNVFTRDDSSPLDLKRAGLADLRGYPVTVRPGEAREVRRAGECFELELDGGERVRARRVLLATGLRDLLPDLPGFQERWGDGVIHCPYCDGWEHRDRRLAVYGGDEAAHHMALTLRLWSGEVTLLSDGPAELSPEQRRDLSRAGVEVGERELERLEGRPAGGGVTLRFRGGDELAVDAVFYSPRQEQSSQLPARLGCALTPSGRVEVDECGLTSVPGVYAAGDMTPNPQYVMHASASGVTAGVAINTALIHEERAAQGASFHHPEAEGASFHHPEVEPGGHTEGELSGGAAGLP